ncbi:MAG: phosphate acyltransferase PlsX [Pseudomonadota bacterium]
MSKTLTLAIDAMGGDSGPEAILEGAARAIQNGLDADFLIYGRERDLAGPLKALSVLAARAELRHADDVIAMEDKPSQVLRRSKNSSMWGAISAVKEGEAEAVVSSGNTGALMAISRLQLRTIEGVARPAIAALWPTPRGRSVVLDVGANVEADAEELVRFAIMGEAFFRALFREQKPSVGLLNVGAEELKGHELIRTASTILQEADPDMNFHGFVEGDDISAGTVDVVVTDGFSGNIALKSAEGTARLVGSYVKGALTGSVLSKLGALFMMGALKELRNKMDPSSVNGGVFLGLNGVVVKSHGGADAKGAASAIEMAANLVGRGFRREVTQTVARVMARAEELESADEDVARKLEGTAAE